MTTFYALTAWKGGLGVTVTILIPDRRTAATLGWCSNKKMAGSQCVECRAVVHRVLSHCLFCKCLFAKTLRQRMADLPYDSHSSMSTCVFLNPMSHRYTSWLIQAPKISIHVTKEFLSWNRPLLLQCPNNLIQQQDVCWQKVVTRKESFVLSPLIGK